MKVLCLAFLLQGPFLFPTWSWFASLECHCCSWNTPLASSSALAACLYSKRSAPSSKVCQICSRKLKASSLVKVCGNLTFKFVDVCKDLYLVLWSSVFLQHELLNSSFFMFVYSICTSCCGCSSAHMVKQYIMKLSVTVSPNCTCLESYLSQPFDCTAETLAHFQLYVGALLVSTVYRGNYG